MLEMMPRFLLLSSPERNTGVCVCVAVAAWGSWTGPWGLSQQQVPLSTYGGPTQGLQVVEVGVLGPG